MGPKRFRRSARFSQLAIAAAREAVADAGLDTAAEADQIGVVVNAAVAGGPETERNVRALIERGPRDLSPYFVPSTILNMAACEVAIDLGVHGPVNASALACASGTAALLEARRLIAGGEADVVIAGGTDAGISRSMFAGLALMGPLSERNDAPEEASRPFDADRDGFVFGEGAVVLVVESAEHAARARRHRLRHGRRRRADLRRLPHLRARAVGRPRRAGHRAGAAQRRRRPGGARLHLRPRHRHQGQRRLRDARDPDGAGQAGLRRARQLAQVDGGPPHRRRRARCRRWSACWPSATGSCPPPPTCTRPTPSATWTTCRSPRAAREVRTAAANAFGFGGPELRDRDARARPG